MSQTTLFATSRQCPSEEVITASEVFVNKQTVPIPEALNCKSKNVIYLWLCKLSAGKEAYFGCTTQECRDIISGHRSTQELKHQG